MSLCSITSMAQEADPFGPSKVPTPPADSDYTAKEILEHKLETITVPKIKFEEVPFFFVLEFLTTRSVELDIATIDPAKKGVNLINLLKDSDEIAITLNLENVTLGEACRTAASLAGGKVIVADYVLEIAAKTAGPVPDIETGGDPKALRKVEKKLATFILPPFELDHIPLSEALQLFRSRAAELDYQEEDIAKKGINLVLEGTDGSFDEPRISLSLSWIRLGDVLKYTAALSGHHITIDGDVITLRPNENE